MWLSPMSEIFITQTKGRKDNSHDWYDYFEETLYKKIYTSQRKIQIFLFFFLELFWIVMSLAGMRGDITFSGSQVTQLPIWVNY